MDEHLKKLTDDFVTQRLGYHGQHETESANEAYMELRAAVEHLREALTWEQRRLLTVCENAYRLADGESQRFYYKAGASDALRLLLRPGDN
jgi:hypothetical protein